MTSLRGLYWLPEMADWRDRLKAFSSGAGDASTAVALANIRLDFVRTNGLDSWVRKRFEAPPEAWATRPVRLALLGSSTLTHLHAAIRVAGLRRQIWIDTHEGDFGQYLQELMNPASALHAFKPGAVLFAFDARHVTQGLTVGMDAAAAAELIEGALDRIRQAWTLAREAFGCAILQQTVLNVFDPYLGENEHRLPGSRRRAVTLLNEGLRRSADEAGVDLVAVDEWAAVDGVHAWHDPALWHRSKQDISPVAAPVWGDLVGRVLAAQQGRSFKALVLDLDNTLWGGVIGDDGLEGIVLGQGSALGEGFVAVQEYARNLATTPPPTPSSTSRQAHDRHRDLCGTERNIRRGVPA